MKEEAHAEKERRLQVRPSSPQKLKEREEELAKYRQERERLEGERAKLQQRRDELKYRIEELRDRNECMRQEHHQRSTHLAIQMNPCGPSTWRICVR